MTVRPSLWPDAPKKTPSKEEGAANHGNGSFPANLIDEIAQVARTLASASGGAVSLDLALDLVLNESVEQAREATRATGAAIALARDGGMICRATTGNAPNLGTRVDTSSGLSAACLQTGRIQQCSDTQLDPRVDREACRHLDLRSMLLVPIMDGGTPRGILEVFSSNPNNFGVQDVALLESMASKIIAAKNASEGGMMEPPSSEVVPALSDHAAEASPPEPKKAAESEDNREPATESLAPEAAPKNDILTSALVVLVIAAAVLLGLIVGVRQTAKLTQDRGAPTKDETASQAISTSGEASSHGNPGESSSPPVVPQPHRVGPPVGGLIVTQNGKVIYRAEPSKRSATSGEGSEALGPGHLVHRVDPQYPEIAKSQHIEGPVVLDAQVLSDGSVGNVAVVEGNPVLAEAATQAVKQWRYQPFVVDGQPVERQERITVRFSLPSS
jgi:TonB family protein